MRRSATIVIAAPVLVSGLLGQTATLRIRVADFLGSPIAVAKIVQLGIDDRPLREFTADDTGELVLGDFPAGFLRFLVSASGFLDREIPVTLHDGEQRTIDVHLMVVPIEDVPELKLEHAPVPQALNQSQDANTESQQSKPAKRHWWQIFR